MSSFEEKLTQEFAKQKQLLKTSKPNVMVLGGTGVGKSSLINKVFGKEVARVGVGEPVTKGCHKYSSETLNVNIFDSEGYEIINGSAGDSNFEQNVIREIKDRQNNTLEEQIHLIWYCISVSTNRLTDYDLTNIKNLCPLSAKLAIVITQCDLDNLDEHNQGKTASSYKTILKREGILCPIFEVMIPSQSDDTFELDQLISWSVEALPEEALRQSFIGAQQHNLYLKEKEAFEIIRNRAIAAATVGVTPIPFADAFVLSGIQIEMALKLSSLYGIPAMGQTIVSLLEEKIISMLGKYLASQITKLIPGVGSVINAGVAGGVTYGLGFGLQKLFYQAQSDFLKTGKKPDWVQLFEMADLGGFNLTDMINKFKQDTKSV